MAADFDLNAYFTRIGYGGSSAPALETLAGIHLCHAQSIPFENLDPYLKRPVHLDIDSLQQKLVKGGRGGYCFEQNLLLSRALTELGFDVTGLAARVLWNAPENTAGARSHMLLRIDMDGDRWIADAGFGGLTLTAPLRLQAGIEQLTPHEPFRLLQIGEYFHLQAKIKEDWKPLYRFDLQPQLPADYEVSNWYLSNHPQSRFLNHLIVARPDQGVRYALMNRELTSHRLDGTTERQTLGDVGELRDVLTDLFKIQFRAIPALMDLPS